MTAAPPPVRLKPVRRLAAGVAALVLSLGATACGPTDNAGPAITIWNRTEQTVTVTYLSPDGIPTGGNGDVGLFAPGAAHKDAVLFRAFAAGKPCLPGMLVAELGGTRIAIIKQPCSGMTWEIHEPTTSAPPSS
jgi:hypothetical protein